MPCNTATSAVTRLSLIHPYPAMIADAVAMRLADDLVAPDARVLDPFCGTSRTLVAAAGRGAHAHGIDVNPLAILISAAKAVRLRGIDTDRLIATSKRFRHARLTPLDLEPGRKVAWFSASAARELTQIIHWLNFIEVPRRARILLSVILSATAREVSYCRKDQWKLHRMAPPQRKSFSPSAWAVFDRRLRRTLHEVQRSNLPGAVSLTLGNALRADTLETAAQGGRFNVLITSPPYGDSRTTVSYGDVSSLCLGVLRHVDGIGVRFFTPSQLDGNCLGGEEIVPVHHDVELSNYWAGGRDNVARPRVIAYLADLAAFFSQVDAVLERRCKAAFVVARRNIGGRRLRLDEFIADRMSRLGFDLQARQSRLILRKNTPYVVDAHGAANSAVPIRTMREEFILTFER
jgi:site-specific DNA-methyltransferase (cytosine-N4-specific)